MKRALLIAYHFPPIRGSSGIQRTLKFATYLREHGWQPIILTVHPRAYAATGEDQMAEIPEDMVVERAFALDTSRHLAIRGSYVGWLAHPDRYVTWLAGGLWSGMRLIRKYRPEVLWSTYPVATAHLLGSWLQRLSGLPWVADFRDSMTEPEYPRDVAQRRAFQRIERQAVHRSARVVFTTPGARAMYAQRYPEVPDDRWAIIPNGYDEDNFAQALGEAEGSNGPPMEDGPLRLVHAGALYPSERDPLPFFRALSRLQEAGRIGPDRLRIVLRATGHDAHYKGLLDELGLTGIVELAPGLPYAEALAEMVAADGLLLFQAANCNHQIPAKLYEYLRAQRPILALTDSAGDTAATLRNLGIDTIFPLDDDKAIERGLTTFLDALNGDRAPVAPMADVQCYSRRAGAAQLATLFEESMNRADYYPGSGPI